MLVKNPRHVGENEHADKEYTMIKQNGKMDNTIDGGSARETPAKLTTKLQGGGAIDDGDDGMRSSSSDGHDNASERDLRRTERFIPPAAECSATTSHSLHNAVASSAMSSVDASKLVAAQKCVQDEIRSGMRLGIGSGSTVRFLIDVLKKAYASGEIKDIQCVPTSYQTREWLREANLPVQSIDVLHELDVTIDGADEVDQWLTCIKGGGGCLLQEKLVQLCAKRFVVLGTEEKYVAKLGTSYKTIPIEVVPYGWAPVKKWITKIVGGSCVLRMDQKKCFPTITENHNYIFDWHFPADVTHDWHNIHQKLINITGVVETGLFINVADVCYLGSADGDVKVVRRN